MLLVSLIDSQNIPKNLLEFVEDVSTIDTFIQELKKYSLVVNEVSKEEKLPSFSLHRSTQEQALEYLLRDLKIDSEQLQKVINGLVGYSTQARIQDNYDNMKAMISHYEKILNNFILTESVVGIIKAELGGIYYNLGYLAKAQKILQECLTHFKTNKEKVIFSFTQSSVYLGAVYKEFGQYEKAKNALEEGVRLCKQYHPQKTLYLGWILSLLARTYRDLGEYDKAKNSLRESLELYPTLDPSNNKHPCALIHLGVVYCYLSQYELAEKFIKRNLEINLKGYPENNINATWALNELGRVYCGLKKYDKAKKLLEKNLDIYSKYYGESHIRISSVLRQLGDIYLLEKNWQKAQKYFEQSLEITKQNKHPKSYKALEKLAIISLEIAKETKHKAKVQDLKIKADNYLKEALMIVEECFPVDSPLRSNLQNCIQKLRVSPK